MVFHKNRLPDTIVVINEHETVKQGLNLLLWLKF